MDLPDDYSDVDEAETLQRKAGESHGAWRLRTSRQISKGMMRLNPDLFQEARAVVRKRVACAEVAGAFGRRPAIN